MCFFCIIHLKCCSFFPPFRISGETTLFFISKIILTVLYNIASIFLFHKFQRVECLLRELWSLHEQKERKMFSIYTGKFYVFFLLFLIDLKTGRIYCLFFIPTKKKWNAWETERKILLGLRCLMNILLKKLSLLFVFAGFGIERNLNFKIFCWIFMKSRERFNWSIQGFSILSSVLNQFFRPHQIAEIFEKSFDRLITIVSFPND